MLSTTQREALVQEAKSWIGTPYRGWSCLKGCGVDCGQLIYGVYRACGLLPEIAIPKDYCLQAGVHQEKSILEDLVAPYFREIPESDLKPGDVALFKTQLRYSATAPGFAHAGIIITWPSYLLHVDTHSGVHGDDANRSPFFKRCPRKFGTLRDEFC